MLLSTLVPVPCRIPPATGGNGSHPNASKVTRVNRQALPALKAQINSVKETEQPLLQERSTVSSRREMMHLTATTLCFAPFFPATAEALPRIGTTKEKIGEKVDELKGKAGELKGKAGLSGEKVDELKGKAGELKEKAGLPNPKDLGKGNEPKGNEANKSKPTNEAFGTKPKSKEDVSGTNPFVGTQ